MLAWRLDAYRGDFPSRCSMDRLDGWPERPKLWDGKTPPMVGNREKGFRFAVFESEREIPDYEPDGHCGGSDRCSPRNSRRIFKDESPEWSDLPIDTGRQLLYGLPAGRRECYGLERHWEKIVVASGFWIGRTEVTQAAYKRIMNAAPSFYKGADLPARTGLVGRTRRPIAAGSACGYRPNRSGNGHAAGGLDLPR